MASQMPPVPPASSAGGTAKGQAPSAAPPPSRGAKELPAKKPQESGSSPAAEESSPAPAQDPKQLPVKPSDRSVSNAPAGASSGKQSAGDGGSGSSKASQAAGQAGKAVQLAQDAKGAGVSMAGDAAAQGVNKAVAGSGENGVRATAGRYAGVATGGAINGAATGGAHGAAVGAATGVAQEAVKDVTRDLGKGEQSKIGKATLLAGSAAATPGVAAMAMLIAIWNYLKAMFFSFLAAVANFWSLFWSGFMYGLKAVGNAIMSGLAAIGNAIATGAAAVGIGTGTVTVAAATVIGSLTGTLSVVVLVGALLTGISSTNSLRNDAAIESSAYCATPVNYRGGQDSGEDISVSEQTEANAKTIYSMFSALGMSDVNISGILGNWTAESQIDPTAVFGIYDEKFQIGPAKQAAWDNNFEGLYSGITNGGIGLGQWINGRNQNLLKYADEIGQEWYELETQIGFMFSPYEGSDADVVRGMITTSLDTPEEATMHFHDMWERSANEAIPQRVAAAEKWFGEMSGWEVDPEAADRVKEIVGDYLTGTTPGGESGGGNVVRALNCDNGKKSSGLAGLTDGGLTMEQAEALTELYNREGDSVLQAKFNGGGPGKCDGSYIENCVSFSWYFVVKYTSYTGGYALGNGVDVAGAMAEVMGKKTSSTPTAYSVFSHGNSSAAGHTGIVLAVDGDRLLIGEAAYCAWPGRARWVEPGEWQNAGWEFTDISDIITDPKMGEDA